MSVMSVKLSAIKRIDEALRVVDTKAETYIALKEDIATHGINDIFTVFDNGDGTYTLGNGDHRFTALCELNAEGRGSDEVVVNVKAKATELEVLRAQIAGNATVTKTTNKAFIKGIYKLATSNEAASMEELAKEAGMTVSYLNRLLKALRLDDEILDLAEKSKVSITNIITLAEIAGKVDNEDIIETYLPLAESQTGKEFVATIAEALDGIKAEKTNKPNEFVAKAKLRSMDEIQVKLASATGVEADMLKWVISLDEPTVAQAKADYDKALAERETKKAERKAAREKEKLEEYRSKLEAEGFVVAPQK